MANIVIEDFFHITQHQFAVVWYGFHFNRLLEQCLEMFQAHEIFINPNPVLNFSTKVSRTCVFHGLHDAICVLSRLLSRSQSRCIYTESDDSPALNFSTNLSRTCLVCCLGIDYYIQVESIYHQFFRSSLDHSENFRELLEWVGCTDSIIARPTFQFF